MFKPFDDNGRELDALYSVEPRPDGFDLIVESRGGSDHGPNAARNSDYIPALELHLSRMGTLGLVLQDLQVASRPIMKRAERDRSVVLDRFSMPLTLSTATDVQELRHSIGRASAAFGRTDGGNGGNRTKRMRLRMTWSRAAGMTADAIERMLARPIHPVAPTPNELPTGDPDELLKRVEKATAQIRAAAKHGTVSPPAGQAAPPRANGTSSRFVRDPNVMAWVLNEAAGHCEVCGKAAPFLRSSGEPYLEVHHVRPLGEGGPDTTDNATACCPNCHRQLHIDPSRDVIRGTLIASVGRLKDYPMVAALGAALQVGHVE